MAVLSDKQFFVIAGVGAVGAFLLYRALPTTEEIAEAGKTALNAVNPVNDQNIFSRAADEVVQATTGDEELSFAGWLLDQFEEERLDL